MQVVFCSRLIFNNKSIISIVFKVSKSPVGSSNNKISGSLAKALAIVLISFILNIYIYLNNNIIIKFIFKLFINFLLLIFFNI